MHILYLQQELIMPGARGNGRCWEMAQCWVKAGHQVTFVTSLAGTPESRNHDERMRSGATNVYEVDGITIHTVDVAFSHMMSFRRRAMAFLEFYYKALRVARRLKGYDIIIAYTAPLSVAALGHRLSRISGKPFCLEVADVWPDVPIGMNILRNGVLIGWLDRKARRFYDDAVAILPYTEGMRDQILSHGPYDDKTTVLHNGANCGEIEFVERHNDTTDVNVLYAGTIGKANQLTQLVSTAHRIQKAGHTNVRFTVLGKGNDETNVRQEAERLGVTNLTFLPAVGHEQVAGFMADADIGVSTFAPYPVLEANGATKFFSYLASGLPVVINHEGWQAEYLRRNNCGLSSAIGDEESFANNLLELANSPEKRTTFARNGRALAEEVFDRRKIAPRYLSVLTDCLSSSHSP